MLDVSIRSGAVGFSTGKVAVTGPEGVEGEKSNHPPPRSIPERYERDLFFLGAGGRGSETLRGLFPNSSRTSISVPREFLHLPLFVPVPLGYFFRILEVLRPGSGRAYISHKNARNVHLNKQVSGTSRETKRMRG